MTLKRLGVHELMRRNAIASRPNSTFVSAYFSSSNRSIKFCLVFGGENNNATFVPLFFSLSIIASKAFKTLDSLS